MEVGLPAYLETDSLLPLRKASLEMKAERSSGHGGDLQRDKNGVPALSAGVRIRQGSFKRKQYRSFLFVRMV